jgi:uncharacterized protein
VEGACLFDWDDHNIEHIAAHHLEPEDVEEALLDPRRIGVPAYNVRDERRWAALGATDTGRILFIVFTRRQDFVRVVTARPATGREQRRYRSRR